MTRRLWAAKILVLVTALLLVIPTLATAAPNVNSGWHAQKRVEYPQTKPLVPGEFDNQHYPVYDDVVSVLKTWEARYPNLVSLYSGGTSLEGRDIPQMTISNKLNVPKGETVDYRPGMFVGGNRHSGEVTARVATLQFANWLLTNYGKDPGVTRLVDTRVFYIRPMENPDGAEMYLTTAQTNRSTNRPYDQDNDGKLDEDPGNDINGDGYVTAMRKYVGPGKGNYAKDPNDKTGRLMINVGEGKGDYLYWSSEGIDDDKDGRVDEDGIGGLDLHRNYPVNWRPMVEYSGYGWTQGGAGEYPLSEPEMRSLVVFLLQHPNVSIGQTQDTSVPMHLRPPSTSKSEESMKAKDLNYYRYFDATGKTLSGYTWAGDVFFTYANRNRGGDPATWVGSPLFGHSPDFGYFGLGVVWYGDELWGIANWMGDFNGDGKTDNYDRVYVQDNGHPNFPDSKGKIFIEWTPANHPDQGGVEVGGWNPKFWSQNPPAGSMLADASTDETMFNQMLAKSLPLITGNTPAVTTVNGKHTITWQLTNEGFLPDAFDQAWLVKIVRQNTATATPGKGVNIATADQTKTLPFFGGQLEDMSLRTQVVTWTATGSGTVTLTFKSTRGGRITTTVTLP